VKHIIQISLGPSRDDYEFNTNFNKQKFKIRRFGTDGDLEHASDLLLQWNKKASAIGLGNIKFPYTIGSKGLTSKQTADLLKLAGRIQTPTTTGDTLRTVGHEWTLRHTQFKFGNNYFNNARVFFFSGMTSHSIAKVMSEYTENLTFADPLLENGVPKFITSPKELKLYASRVRDAIHWLPGKRLIATTKPVRSLIDYLMRQAVKKSHILVVPHFDFYKYLDHYTADELKGKTVITSTAYDDRIDYLKDKGVDVIIDTTPKLLETVVGVSVLEALLCAALDLDDDVDERDNELLEIISEMKMDPRIIYPSGSPKRVNRFAYLVHPLSRDFLKKLKPIEVLADIARSQPDRFPTTAAQEDVLATYGEAQARYEQIVQDAKLHWGD